MDGKRIRDYWSDEVAALIRTYRQFERLIPSERGAGAAHAGEDGRYVEDLIREYLNKFLPRGIEVLTGFILRPAVKTGRAGRERRCEDDKHSGQLDIIVFDSANYPTFQRFGNSAIVPPEGVIAIISVKKHLNDIDIAHECLQLLQAAALCRVLRSNKHEDKLRGPYLALVSVRSNIKKSRTDVLDWIFKKLEETYENCDVEPTFDQLVGYIGAFDEWSVFKRRPKGKLTKAEYVGFKHHEDETHLGLQFLLTGIMSVLYDDSRNERRRPGFTAFPSGRAHDKLLGSVPCHQLR